MPAPEWGQGRSRAHRQGGNPRRNWDRGDIAFGGIGPGNRLRAVPGASVGAETSEDALDRCAQQDRCQLPDAHAQQHMAGKVLSAGRRTAIRG